MLPIQIKGDKDFIVHQTTWAAQINPVLANPLTNGIILQNISITNGPNVINHRLGRLPQGWVVIDKNAPATIYRDTAYTSLTITVTSDVACIASFYVF